MPTTDPLPARLVASAGLVIGFLVLRCISIAVQIVNYFDLVALEYDPTAAVNVVVCGRVLKRIAAEDFPGWGHPFAPLFTRNWKADDRSRAPGPPRRLTVGAAR